MSLMIDVIEAAEKTNEVVKKATEQLGTAFIDAGAWIQLFSIIVNSAERNFMIEEQMRQSEEWRKRQEEPADTVAAVVAAVK